MGQPNRLDPALGPTHPFDANIDADVEMLKMGGLIGASRRRPRWPQRGHKLVEHPARRGRLVVTVRERMENG